ncbi:MAG: hypothetical protein ACRDNM_05570 [Gaiellaceae bacterium]
MLFASLHSVIHWPDNRGYNFVSGPLADITLATGFAAWIFVFLRKHNCHIQGCWRLEWHEDPVTGHPVCRHHHPEGAKI